MGSKIEEASDVYSNLSTPQSTVKSTNSPGTLQGGREARLTIYWQKEKLQPELKA